MFAYVLEHLRIDISTLYLVFLSGFQILLTRIYHKHMGSVSIYVRESLLLFELRYLPVGYSLAGVLSIYSLLHYYANRGALFCENMVIVHVVKIDL